MVHCTQVHNDRSKKKEKTKPVCRKSASIFGKIVFFKKKLKIILIIIITKATEIIKIRHLHLPAGRTLIVIL